MKAIIIDVEATDVSDEAQATEIAVVDLIFHNDKVSKIELKNIKSSKCLPEKTISFGAMATSKIFLEDLQDFDNHRDVCHELIPKDVTYIVGHNIDFDLRVVANAGVNTDNYKAICTLSMLRHLYPEQCSHTLAAMSCMLDYDFTRKSIENFHGASFDVLMTARLLYKICRLKGITNIEELHKFSEFTRVPTHITFGKHKGCSLEELAKTKDGVSYLKWIINNIKDNKYLTEACKSALSK